MYYFRPVVYLIFMLFSLTVSLESSAKSSSVKLFGKDEKVEVGGGFLMETVSFVKKPGFISGYFDYFLEGTILNQSGSDCDLAIFSLIFYDEKGNQLGDLNSMTMRKIKDKDRRSFRQKIISTTNFQSKATNVTVQFARCTKNLMKSIRCSEACQKKCVREGHSKEECFSPQDKSLEKK